MVATTERVMFRLIIMQCCHFVYCHVNPRFPTHCPECGKHIYPEVKGWVVQSDDNAILKLNLKAT
jgi:hypothetical protein